MNLYRIDPPAWNDGLLRRLSDVKRIARDRAAETGTPVGIARIDGRTLQCRVAYLVYSNGDCRKVT